jgi:peptidyl-prolyl cis-trans isomerase C
MMKNPLLAATVSSALLLAGCDTNKPEQQTQTTSEASKPAPSAENSVAVVNGEPISKTALSVLTSELHQRRGNLDIPKDKLVDELVSREILRQEAEKKKLTEDATIAAKLENAQRVILSQAAAEDYLKTVSISDDEVKKEYDQRIGAMKQTEYKARHILVEKEDTAKDIIKKLQRGDKFEALAKKYSKDPGAANGGDLGWFSPQQMVPPFTEAVVALKNGEYTTKPVKTEFGWHVILREDAREKAPPPFDSVKDQIRSLLQTQKLQQHIAELKNTANIVKFEEKQETPPPAKDAPAKTDTGEQAPAGEPAKPAEDAAQPQPQPAQ